MPHKFPKIHAHKGFSEEAPGNTLRAFEKAIDSGIDAIEFDIQQTIDGGVIVHHDYILGRNSNGTGLVALKTLAELRALDGGSWFSPEFANEKLPLFDEVLMLGQGRCGFEIQLCSISEGFIKQVLSIIEVFDVLDTVEITSTYLHLLMKVRQLHSSVKIGVILTEAEWMPDELWTMYSLQTMELISGTVAHIPVTRLNANIVQAFKNQHYLIHAANCNDTESIRLAAALNVDQFTTDTVRLAFEIRSSLSENAST